MDDLFIEWVVNDPIISGPVSFDTEEEARKYAASIRTWADHDPDDMVKSRHWRDGRIVAII